MRYLLDTHTLAWAVGDPDLLGPDARRLLQDPANELLVSPVSIWEMSIKHRAGRWPDVGAFLDDERYAQISLRLGVREFPIRISHARLAGGFSVEHKDPFDRMLAAQAILEGVPIVSKDARLDAFAVARAW